MLIAFEQFILIFNNLSKLFYHEINGTAKKQRMYCASYTDHEFTIIHERINETIKQSNIKEKYNIVASKDYNITLFVVDGVEDMNGYHHPFCIEKSIFENGTNNLTIVVTESIKDASNKELLHHLYAGIIRAVLYFLCPEINSRYIGIHENEESESASSALPVILAYTLIDYTGESYKEYIDKILEYAKTNCDFIQLLPDPELMRYIDSILF